MDLDYVLSWMVGLGSAFNAAASLRGLRPRMPGWFAVHVVLLVTVALGALEGQAGVGYVTGACWAAFVLLPMSAARRHFDLAVQYRLDEALFWARVAAWLHPFDGLPDQARYFTALVMADRGRRERARELFRRLRSAPGFQQLASIAELRVEEDWDAIVDYVESRPVNTRDLRLAPWFVRGLGECGRPETMLATYLSMPPQVRYSLILQLQVAAFLGRVDLVRTLRDAHFAHAPNSEMEYWLAIAEQSHGDALDAKLRLGRLREDPALGARASKRLKSPLSAVDPRGWSGQSEALLRRFEDLVSSGPPWLEIARVKPWATWALTVIFCVAFTLELPGGSENERNLISLGALVLPHEGSAYDLLWRIFASGFLHYGPVHLTLNVLCFWIIGRVLERERGFRLLLTSFFAGSIGAFALACFYLAKPDAHATVLVGASAGIYGLVGALGMLSLVGWVVNHNPMFRQRLGVVVVIVGAQMVFDWFTPITSSFLHLTGFGMGALSALPWAFGATVARKKRLANSGASRARKLQRR